MRATYRKHAGNAEYWRKRWEKAEVDDGLLNLDEYPGRFAESLINQVSGPVLEIGCGMGRVMLHYHRKGVRIIGMDTTSIALEKICAVEPDAELVITDINDLSFRDDTFAGILAFGLYHNLENEIDAALRETRRIMKPGALLCASVRVDNIQNRIIDQMAGSADKGEGASFHKMNYLPREFISLLKTAGFRVKGIEYVENMPFLYKFRFFRDLNQKRFDEHKARSEGYRLSFLGRIIQKSLMRLMPVRFCNLMVVTAQAI